MTLVAQTSAWSVAAQPPGKWNRLDRHQHVHTAQFYENSTALLDELERYIGSALDEGNSAIVVATAEHREGLAERLRARGCDLDRAVAQGRYVALDAAAILAAVVTD